MCSYWLWRSLPTLGAGAAPTALSLAEAAEAPDEPLLHPVARPAARPRAAAARVSAAYGGNQSPWARPSG
ncbi:hypothetical protein GXW82_37120 [Streptacidiphilus sp. 4-A2]|nr:hypothetical protein [Streptacidiphilus sp. 4-A2]